jgi:hypothetical protein
MVRQFFFSKNSRDILLLNKSVPVVQPAPFCKSHSRRNFCPHVHFMIGCRSTFLSSSVCVCVWGSIPEAKVAGAWRRLLISICYRTDIGGYFLSALYSFSGSSGYVQRSPAFILRFYIPATHSIFRNILLTVSTLDAHIQESLIGILIFRTCTS